MNHVELNAILYYSDFLSLKETSLPVTDTCKYFYIHSVPINSAFILNMEPQYDVENPYFKLAYLEYSQIKNKYGEDGVETFIDEICSIRACGCVDAERMLNCIHLYSGKLEKQRAFKVYNSWRKNQIFFHTTINENGDPQQKECSKYVYHAERMLGRPGLAASVRDN